MFEISKFIVSEFSIYCVYYFFVDNQTVDGFKEGYIMIVYFVT